MMVYRICALLLVFCLAPACAPSSDKEGKAEQQNPRPLVLLTDASTWAEEDLTTLKDSLEAAHYRVLVSGFSDETPEQLVARLPWLLQPGVSLFLYDEALAGATGEDSLRNALQRLGHDAPVQVLQR